MTLHANRGNARRTALLRLGALCGLTLAGDIPAALAAARRTPAAALLTADELTLTGVLAELIIPRTDTPGALGVGAHRTIDHLLNACTLPPAQQAFKAGLAGIDAVAREQTGKGFTHLPQTRQVALLHALDEGGAPFSPQDQQFFRQLKSYTVFAYYTSEVGASRELAYLPVPGGFKTIKLSKTTRTWAL
ncbi:MAG: gluconate 2-dehydrogenase subunit 3 family protein [Gammaproteobacteria bacterium]